MISLLKILAAMEDLEIGLEPNASIHINEAIKQLEEANEAADKMVVCGREAVDAMLGCMVGIDMIIGKEEKNG